MDTQINHNLPSFKYLLINSFGFIKSNWKDLVLFFAPIQALILLIVILFDFNIFDGESTVLSILAIVALAILWAVTFFRKLVVFGGGFISSQIEKGEKNTVMQWYKIFCQKIVPIVHVGALSVLIILAFTSATIVLGTIIFALPFILLGLVARVSPAILEFIPWQSQMITFSAFFIVFFAIIITNLLFFVSTWFSSYVLLLEEKKGLDAIASSFMYVHGRRWQIVWRVLVIVIISSIPILILLAPIYYKIIANALGQMALVYAFGLQPVFPEVPRDLALWRDVLSAFAGLVYIPVFVVLNYFLWKDVKATTVQFDETAYTKTRKWLKIISWIGLLIAVVMVCAVFISGQFVSKNSADNIVPRNIPASGIL